MAHALAEETSRVAGRWSDLGLRIASAAVLAPLSLVALWAGGLAWIVLIAVLLAGLGTEWARLVAPRLVVVVPAALLAALAAALLGWGFGGAVLALGTLLLGWREGWFAAAGIPYMGVSAFALVWLRLMPGVGLRDTVFLVTVVWVTDIGAYLAGRVFGGARLAPRISPAKTWSGAAGGLIFAAGAGWALTAGDPRGVGAALLLSLAAQGGDLLESAMKRRLGVKDSGRTIPGHGGLFDRLDGFLAATPLAALAALSVQGGLPLWR